MFKLRKKPISEEAYKKPSVFDTFRDAMVRKITHNSADTRHSVNFLMNYDKYGKNVTQMLPVRDFDDIDRTIGLLKNDKPVFIYLNTNQQGHAFLLLPHKGEHAKQIEVFESNGQNLEQIAKDFYSDSVRELNRKLVLNFGGSNIITNIVNYQGDRQSGERPEVPTTCFRHCLTRWALKHMNLNEYNRHLRTVAPTGLYNLAVTTSAEAIMETLKLVDYLERDDTRDDMLEFLLTHGFSPEEEYKSDFSSSHSRVKDVIPKPSLPITQPNITDDSAGQVVQTNPMYKHHISNPIHHQLVSKPNVAPLAIPDVSNLIQQMRASRLSS